MARPLGFDPADARAALMNLFWARGYEATSLQDIEAATGLRKQSLYRYFGDKRAMYLAALRTYEDCVIAEAERHLHQTPGPARLRFAALLDWVIGAGAAEGDMRGCFLTNACAEAQSSDPVIAAALAAMVGRMERAFLGTLACEARYRDAPDLARSRCAHLLAAYVGLQVLAKGACDQAALRAAVDDLLAIL